MNFTAVREAQLGYIPVNQIVEDTPFCFRPSGDLAVSDIHHSFLRHGQAHPVLLESVVDGKYRILDGHRRYRAVLSIHAEGGTWHKLLAHVVPSDLSPLERFRILRERNDGADGSFGISERGRFFAAFRRLGLCVSTIAREYGVTISDVEDILELGDMPAALAARIDHEPLAPVFAAMLARRYRGWIAGPYASAANTVLNTLLAHAARETLTIKSWRFLLDFYWGGDRPFMAPTLEIA